MRDNYYRNLCFSPAQYDEVINLIKRENPYCAKLAAGEREEFACKVVHDCIRSVVFENVGSYYGTGCALAVRVSNDQEKPGYWQVLLAFCP